jgi:hypothetical protein
MPRRAQGFILPHCPNPRCDSHVSPDTWRFKKSDCFERSKGPRRVQRYVCQRCLRNFSSQTFAVDYWLKSPHLLKAVFWGIVNCSGLRQISRASAGFITRRFSATWSDSAATACCSTNRCDPGVPRKPSCSTASALSSLAATGHSTSSYWSASPTMYMASTKQSYAAAALTNRGSSRNGCAWRPASGTRTPARHPKGRPGNCDASHRGRGARSSFTPTRTEPTHEPSRE